ncbi:MAG: hypothetical protein ACFFCS_20365 [Candidatus Hodarchaeota archaeon]
MQQTDDTSSLDFNCSATSVLASLLLIDDDVEFESTSEPLSYLLWGRTIARINTIYHEEAVEQENCSVLFPWLFSTYSWEQEGEEEEQFDGDYWIEPCEERETDSMFLFEYDEEGLIRLVSVEINESQSRDVCFQVNHSINNDLNRSPVEKYRDTRAKWYNFLLYNFLSPLVSRAVERCLVLDVISCQRIEDLASKEGLI